MTILHHDSLAAIDIRALVVRTIRAGASWEASNLEVLQALPPERDIAAIVAREREAGERWRNDAEAASLQVDFLAVMLLGEIYLATGIDLPLSRIAGWVEIWRKAKDSWPAREHVLDQLGDIRSKQAKNRDIAAEDLSLGMSLYEYGCKRAWFLQRGQAQANGYAIADAILEWRQKVASIWGQTPAGVYQRPRNDWATSDQSLAQFIGGADIIADGFGLRPRRGASLVASIAARIQKWREGAGNFARPSEVGRIANVPIDETRGVQSTGAYPLELLIFNTMDKLRRENEQFTSTGSSSERKDKAVMANIARRNYEQFADALRETAKQQSGPIRFHPDAFAMATEGLHAPGKLSKDKPFAGEPATWSYSDADNRYVRPGECAKLNGKWHRLHIQKEGDKEFAWFIECHDANHTHGVDKSSPTPNATQPVPKFTPFEREILDKLDSAIRYLQSIHNCETSQLSESHALVGILNQVTLRAKPKSPKPHKRRKK